MDITDSCLDAETLAAWTDGGLSAAELERAQTHVADCARCQVLVGTLARINSAVEPTAVESTFRSATPWRANTRPARAPWLAWLVPLTAAAAAVALWVAVPGNTFDQPRSASVTPAIGSKDAGAEPQAPAATAEVAAPKAELPAVQEQLARQNPLGERERAERRSDAPAPSELDSLAKQQTPSSTMAAAEAVAEAPSAAPAAPAPLPDRLAGIAGGIPAAAPPPNAQPASAGAANTLGAVAGSAPAFARLAQAAPLEIASPDPNIRWRIAGTSVERSANGGVSWQATSTGVSTGLTAGAAPSAAVCWVVGRAGVVLLSTDGGSWRRLPFPETTDLSAVRARDARAASVTTADGRVFSTNDAGSSWISGPLQGF